MQTLSEYDWPGNNVRELNNVIERAIILCDTDMLSRSHLSIQATPALPDTNTVTLAEADRVHILKVLEQTNWVVGGPSGAASRLGLKRTTLIARMKKLGISRRNHQNPMA